ncbi:MAG: hypothetical protein ACRCY5_04715 [Phocaeicola sp.]
MVLCISCFYLNYTWAEEVEIQLHRERTKKDYAQDKRSLSTEPTAIIDGNSEL